MNKVSMPIFFVYQLWIDDTLYSKGLTAKQASEDFDTLNRLIESGSHGDGCAAIGRLDDATNYWLCKRLGILEDFYTIQQMKADGFVFED